MVVWVAVAAVVVLGGNAEHTRLDLAGGDQLVSTSRRSRVASQRS
jgi:hypothetical protein